MLHLHTSNRLELLAEELAALLERDPPADPFAPLSATVAHPGMGRWLELRLAERLGAVLGAEFPLPGRTAWRLLRAAAGEEGLPEEDPLDPPRLALRLWQALQRGGLALPPALLPGEDPRGLRRWRLAVALAQTLEQLVLYRPDWILDWEAGRPGFGGDEGLRRRFGWQAELWRRLLGGRPHRLRLAVGLLERLEAGRPPAGLPPRLLLFGISHLPPLYLDLFLACARHLEVHLFLVQPSAEYWGDAPGRREARRRLLGAGAEGALDPELVHPLLALWGREARELVERLYDRLDGLPHQVHERFAEPRGGGALQRLQRSLLHLDPAAIRAPAGEPGGPGGPGGSGEGLPDGDPEGSAAPSLLVHASHSPMRACQEAVQAILAARRRDPGLQPREIAILAVDIDAYAPLLEAAFEALPEEARLPYAIVDRRADQALPLLEAVLALLALPGLRPTAAWLRALLDEPAILRRRGIDPEQLPALEAWLADQGVSWDLGREEGPEPGDRHSLAYGEARALAGYALPEDPFRLFADIAPAAATEGELAQAVGGLLELGERLRHWRERLARPRPLGAWCRITAELVADLLEPRGEELEQLRPLQEALEGLERDAALLAGEGEAEGGDPAALSQGPGLSSQPSREVPMSPALFRAVLEGRLALPRVTEGYLAGSITCCALQPLRHLPFRHIHVLGLGQEAFPRPDRRPALDPLTVHRRPGDRSPPEDDRLAMLETLLAAREALHLHYVCRDPRDQSPRQPSSVVVELLELLGTEGEGPEGSPYLRRHPMQPFSPARFRPGGQPAGSPEETPAADPSAADPLWLQAARGLAGPRRPPPLLLGPEEEGGAPAPGGGAGPVVALELAELERFLRTPLAWALSRGLGVSRDEEPLLLPEHERFALDGLEAYRLRERLWRAFAEEQGMDEEALRARLAAEGLLPSGIAGERAWREEAGAWERLRRRLGRWWGEPLPPRRLDLPFATPGGPGRLSGWVEGLRRDPRDPAEPPRLLRVRVGDRRPQDLLALWAGLLAACAAGEPPREARLVARDGDLRLAAPAPAEARERLAALAALAARALVRPLPLFPEAVVQALKRRRLPRGTLPKAEPSPGEAALAQRLWGAEAPEGVPEGLALAEELAEELAGALAGVAAAQPGGEQGDG